MRMHFTATSSATPTDFSALTQFGFPSLIHTVALARWIRVSFSPSETVSRAITYLVNPLTGRCVYSHVPAELRLRRRM